MLGQRSLSLFSLQDAAAVRKLSRRDTRLGRQVKAALDIIDEALKRYGNSLALSFNGGKDCTVLVHLFATAVCSTSSSSTQQDSSSSSSSTSPSLMNGQTSSTSPAPNGSTSSAFPATNGNHTSSTSHTSTSTSCIQPPIPCIYVQCQSPFPQVESFVDLCRARYNLDLWRISAPMKEALSQYKSEHLNSSGNEVKAVLVGTRIGDPYSETLKPFQMTDKGWPDMMRVHPILDWTYDDIWAFLRSEELGKGGIGWCSLYNYGYTSLGSTFNTIPNPLLRDPSHENGWKPAWDLQDASAERAGRPAGPIPADIAKTLDTHTHHYEEVGTSTEEP